MPAVSTSLPTPYDESVAQQLCDAFAAGTALADACEELSVPLEDVIRWAMAKESRDEFAQQLADACASAAEFLYDLLHQITELPPTEVDGRLDKTEAAWRGQQSRVLRWAIEKLGPERFAPRRTVDVSVVARSAPVVFDLGEDDIIPKGAA